jgi:DNA-binding response OmpR family regulator
MFPSLGSSSSALASRPTRKLRVVVIDDEPDTVMMLLALLRSEGYETKGYSSGREALKNLEEFDPDVVICDVAMPSVNGWDVAREVRRVRGQERPLLVAISGHYTSAPDQILGKAAGFDHYLIKPCDPKALIDLLAR